VYQNRGIGEAIAHTLASQSHNSFVLYAASRKGVDMGFETNSGTQVKYPKLDIADLLSIRGFAKVVKEDHGAVDVLINNAGVNLDDQYSAESVRTTLDTNVRGTLHVSGCVLEKIFGRFTRERHGFQSSRTGDLNPLISFLSSCYQYFISYKPIRLAIEPWLWRISVGPELFIKYCLHGVLIPILTEHVPLTVSSRCVRHSYHF